mmetsp:Transcript_20100/g.42333  ORF Transcript_20100/g.42333 Transcript_20100/m.42333 type:complete len:367 (+) Transcript_20100:274-1374(+)
MGWRSLPCQIRSSRSTSRGGGRRKIRQEGSHDRSSSSSSFSCEPSSLPTPLFALLPMPPIPIPPMPMPVLPRTCFPFFCALVTMAVAFKLPLPPPRWDVLPRMVSPNLARRLFRTPLAVPLLASPAGVAAVAAPEEDSNPYRSTSGANDPPRRFPVLSRTPPPPPPPAPLPSPMPPAATLARSECLPCMYLEKEDSAFSDMTSASERRRVVSLSSTPAKASRDREREASRDWHMEIWASATSSSISPSTAKTLAISSPTLSLLSFMILICSSYSGDSSSFAPSLLPLPLLAFPPFLPFVLPFPPLVSPPPFEGPLTPFGGFKRQAPESLLVASAMSAPHFPKVLALAEISLRVSVRTTRLRISLSM